jgi:hypothetical protein
VVLWLLYANSAEARRVLRESCGFKATFLPWVVGIALLTATYVAFFWSAYFYVRYLSPTLVVAVPLLAIGLAELPFVQKNPLPTLTALMFFFCLWDIPSLHTGHMGSSQFINAGYVHRFFPDARVGAFQSGTMGYFDPNVENLDGKLSYGALMAKREHREDRFVDSEQIDVLVDWSGLVYALPHSYLSREWQSCPEPMLFPDSVCLMRKSMRAPPGQ